MSSIPPWTRADTRPTGRLADVALVVFHRGPLADAVPLSLERHGAPSVEAVARVDVTPIADPAWLAGWRSGGIRTVAEQDLGAGGVAVLDTADRCHFLRATIIDPPELSYLQAAWAVARWLVDRGATVVLDAFALRFHTAASLAAEDVRAPLAITREISVVYETEPAAARLGHVVHTRGLGKLARPDLIALVDPREAGAAADVLCALAQVLADGFMPTTAGARPPLPDSLGLSVTLHPMEQGSLAEALHLNNDAWLVELDRRAS